MSSFLEPGTLEYSPVASELEFAADVYKGVLKDAVRRQDVELNIDPNVVSARDSIIAELERVDEELNTEWAIEAREVLLLSLELGSSADGAMGVRTNPSAVSGAGGTHDGGKVRVARRDPGILIRSHNGTYTEADHEANKRHVLDSADMAREGGMPLVEVELFPGGPVQLVDIANVDQASHDKQKKGPYGFGPLLNWAERRVRDYVTIADQVLAMLFRDNSYNRHMSLEERWAWVEGTPEEEGAVAHVLNDYWYPPQVVAAVIEAIKQSELVRFKLEQKYGAKYRVSHSVGYTALAAA